MFRRIGSASPAIFAAVAVVKVAEKPESAKEVDEKAHYKCKPSELPLYAPLHSFNKVTRDTHPIGNSNDGVYGTLESGVRVVRQEVQTGYRAVADQLQVLGDYVDTAKAHSESAISYLNQPHNVLPRSGAIAIGGLSGFIFAARGGFIKKVLYTTIGAGAIASICYPTQAEHFARDALFESRKGYAIAYNFVKGVKPGDEVPIEPINKFPTSLQDVKFLVYDLYDEAVETLFPDKKK